MQTSPTHILFFRFDTRVGDGCVHSFVVRELKKQFPNARLTVATVTPSDKWFQLNPYVDEIISLPPLTRLGYLHPRMLGALLNMLWKCYQGKYDLIIPNPVRATWRNKFYCRLLPHTVVPTFDYTRHITHTYKNLLQMLGAKQVDTSYEIKIPAQALDKTNQFLKKHFLTGENYGILAPYGSSGERVLSNEQITAIVQKSPLPLIILDFQHRLPHFPKTFSFVSSDILEVVALVQQARAVISVDTGIVHLADTFKKPLFVLYANDRFGPPHNHLFWSSVQPQTVSLQSATTIAQIPISDLENNLSHWFSQLP